MTSKIEPRFGAEVFVNQYGKVIIKQELPGEEYPELVILHRDEVLELIEMLKRHYQEALDFTPEPESEETEAM